MEDKITHFRKIKILAYSLMILILINQTAAARTLLYSNEMLTEDSNTLILDGDDTGGDVTLQFGTTLNEQLYWNNAGNTFAFTDDLSISGDLTVTGVINTGSGAVQITQVDGTLDGEQIGDNTVDDDSLDFGTGTDQISAVDIPMANTSTYFDASELEGLVEEVGLEMDERWSTGLVSGGAITDNGGNTINIASGVGYINYNSNYNKRVTWDAINNVSLTYSGDNYIYIDSTGSEFISNSTPTTGERIFLGYVYTIDGNSDIGTVASVPSYIGDHARLVNNWLQNAVGPIIASGNIVSEGGTNLTLSVTSGRIYNNLQQILTTDKTTFTKWYNTADDGWVIDSYNPNYVNETQINNASNNASTDLTGTVTFTNGSTNVSGSGTSFSSEVVAGDYIYLTGDGKTARALVSSVDSNTQITLAANYAGTGVAGTGVKDEALEDMTAGYWKKDLVIRTMDDNVHYIYGQAEYSTEQAAKDAAMPTIPNAISTGASAYLATIVLQKGDSSISSRLYDVRPNFERVFSFGTEGTTGSVADHGALSGLGDDDHSLYFNTDGSDTMGGDLNVGNNAILNATIDGDLNTLQDIPWTSIDTRAETLVLIPEYKNMIIDEDGTANVATLRQGNDATNDQQYYKLSSGQASLQDLDIYLLVKLPDDFVSWQATPIQIYLKSSTTTAGDNQVDITVKDTANTSVTLTGGTDLKSDSADTWVQKSITYNGSPTWTAGDWMTIRLNLQAKDSNAIYVSDIKLNYNGR
ncbi:hypothetical protein GF354_00530 [Candidatus Peregrinibacteria bacterium]|nr:hypothetical protein [Candidatus Peregrinibacteria bacterium]